MEVWTPERIAEALYEADGLDLANRWLRRGDGLAVYENCDLGSMSLGALQFVSFGSESALLETEEPPEQLPDIGNAINWRYRLVAQYRGRPLPLVVV